MRGRRTHVTGPWTAVKQREQRGTAHVFVWYYYCNSYPHWSSSSVLVWITCIPRSSSSAIGHWWSAARIGLGGDRENGVGNEVGTHCKSLHCRRGQGNGGKLNRPCIGVRSRGRRVPMSADTPRCLDVNPGPRAPRPLQSLFTLRGV